MGLPTIPDDGELDARIQRAELALIARNQRVQHQVAVLGTRFRRARDPARLAVRWGLPAAAGALTLLAGQWLWRKWRRRPAAGAERSTGERHADGPRDHHHAGFVGGGLGWLEMVALAWPLLPEGWRRRWGPTSTAAMMNLGTAASRYLMDGLARVRDDPAQHPPLQTAEHVDLARYAGAWHEIARLPTEHEDVCDGQPQAHYTLRRDGLLEVLNHCVDAAGHERVAIGEARALPGGHGARLEVSFLPAWLRWLPFGWADYWVLYVDEGYTLALVGEPRRRQLWILAREQRIAPSTFDALAEMARDQGFPVDRLVLSQMYAPPDDAPIRSP
jgi:apolipoprotein D and lipocalin family protein